MACPSECADFEQVEITSASCQPTFRYNSIKRLGFSKCNVVLPSPLTCLNLPALFAAKDIVVSNPLFNVVIGEPNVESRQISDCAPPQDYVTTRDVTFEDRIAVDVDINGDEAKFLDWSFWKDKNEHSGSLNYFFIMCDGSIIVPRAKNSLNGLAASFRSYLNFEKVTDGHGAIEFKAGKVTFLGDPFDFTAPELNLNDCPELAQYA